MSRPAFTLIFPSWLIVTSADGRSRRGRSSFAGCLPNDDETSPEETGVFLGVLSAEAAAADVTMAAPEVTSRVADGAAGSGEATVVMGVEGGGSGGLRDGSGGDCNICMVFLGGEPVRARTTTSSFSSSDICVTRSPSTLISTLLLSTPAAASGLSSSPLAFSSSMSSSQPSSMRRTAPLSMPLSLTRTRTIARSTATPRMRGRGPPRVARPLRSGDMSRVT
eukprot:1586079-Prymnesium_polylepis.1